MKSTGQSLRQYLQTPNPQLYGAMCKNGPTTGSSTTYHYPAAVYEWNEFEYDTLNVFSNGDLKRFLDGIQDLKALPDASDTLSYQFSDKNSFQRVLTSWNLPIVNEALRKSYIAASWLSENAFLSKGRLGRSQFSQKRLFPDWSGITTSTSLRGIKNRTSLPGEAKVSRKWTSKSIIPGRLDFSPDRSRWDGPIGQIFTCCLLNHTRYGYIITDTELVAIRISLEEDTDGASLFAPTNKSSQCQRDAVLVRARNAGILEYKSIPWEGSNDLSINMALWWLHIMANGNTGIGDRYCALHLEIVGPDSNTQVSLIVAR